MMVDYKPVTINEAQKKKVCVSSTKEDLESIERNKTWKLIFLSLNKKSISMRWIFMIKLKPDGSLAKHKARLVAIGFLQKYGLDYFKVFAPVARHETIRLVISIATNKNSPLIHLNVKSSFSEWSIERRSLCVKIFYIWEK